MPGVGVTVTDEHVSICRDTPTITENRRLETCMETNVTLACTNGTN